MKKIYIAGPMSIVPGGNEEAFVEAVDFFSEAGWSVCNPAENGSIDEIAAQTNLTKNEAYRKCMAFDLKYLCEEADAIYMLKGWEKSPGAKAEHATATCLGLTIKYQG